jgi:hypothetical protein
MMPQGQLMPQAQMAPQQYGMSPYMGQALNTGSIPAVYAASVPPAAQMYSSGVPGAPPTFAVPTDDLTMSQYGNLSGQGPRVQRSSTTMKRRSNQPFGSAEQEKSVDSNTRINVIKGS